MKLVPAVALLVGIAAAAAATPVPDDEAPATVVFLSDFGIRDAAVAICKGVMLEVAPRLRIVDLTHEVTPFAVADGARLLAETAPYYPAGTVFVAVIDPGVGTSRRPMVARTGRGQYFVVPDNGLTTLVAERDGLEGAREIANDAWMRAHATASTFHGRDVFSPVAAHLARGDDWTAVGPPITDPVTLPLNRAALAADGVRGEAVALDGQYGNVLTNVDAPLFAQLGWQQGDVLTVRVGNRDVRLVYAATFGAVPQGRPLLYVDSRERIGLAVNQGSFARTYDVHVPVVVRLPRKTPPQRPAGR